MTIKQISSVKGVKQKEAIAHCTSVIHRYYNRLLMLEILTRKSEGADEVIKLSLWQIKTLVGEASI